MKRILIAGALALAAAAPAFAADLPPPAAPPPRAPVAYVPAAPVFNWTGFYVGLNAGYAFGNSSWTTPVGIDRQLLDVRPVGRRYRSAAITRSVSSSSAPRATSTGRISRQPRSAATAVLSPAPPVAPAPAIGSARSAARAGFAIDRVLLYVTGGGAFANIKASTRRTAHGPAARNWVGPPAPASKSP